MFKGALEENFCSLEVVESKLNELCKEYQSNYVRFNSEIKDKFEKKYTEFSISIVKLQNYINDYDYIIKKQDEKEKNLENRVHQGNDLYKIEDIKDTLNKYFKKYTDK